MVNNMKMIKLSDDRIIKLDEHENYIRGYRIEEYFIRDDEMHKNYSLSVSDDYGFNAWLNASLPIREKTKAITFEFDIDHPLYLPFLHLLGGDESLIIDDDSTRELNKKYMKLSKEEEKIVLSFVNELWQIDILTQFNVFVKNVYKDGRSKVDRFNKDTKDRLYFFFKEAMEALTQDYRQISIEEYLLKNNDHEDEEVKKYTKAMIPKWPRNNETE